MGSYQDDYTATWCASRSVSDSKRSTMGGTAVQRAVGNLAGGKQGTEVVEVEVADGVRPPLECLTLGW